MRLEERRRRWRGRAGWGRRPRPDPEKARDPAQLPGGRAPAVLARAVRAGAASVHRDLQRRGAAVQPGPAALGLRQRPSSRTTTSASAPTTTSSTSTATRSSSTAPSPARARRPPRTPARRSPLPSAKILGGPRGRAEAFRPRSVVNISGMSFGALSGNAIEALNHGAAMAGCMHNTGEGALSPHHRNGGDVIFQIGTSYFGCRDEHGRFDLARLKDVVASRTGEGDRDQALARGQARARRHAAGGEGERRDRGDPRHPGRRRLRVPEPAPGLPRRRLDARLRRAGRRPRPGFRSASSRRSATWTSGTTWSPRWPRAARRRLRQHRRR